MREIKRHASDKPSEAVAVKPLEWIGYNAQSLIGWYRIKHDGDEPYEWSYTGPNGIPYWYEDEERAKAAAHADYEKRILSTLTPQPAESAKIGDGVRDGVAEIAAERRRQMEAEGWTPEHDDQHTDGELSAAAACYAVGRQIIEGGPTHFDGITRLWPWSQDWWKPKDRIRDLVRAGALIAAEIDRLTRIDAEVARILAMSDDDLYTEVRARGEDPAEVAARTRTAALGDHRSD